MLEPKDIPTILELSRDSEDPFNIAITDERDELEDLTVFDQAKLEIKEGLDLPALVTRETGSNLVINTTDSTLDCEALTTAELVLLLPGRYLCDIMMHETGEGWHRSDRLWVDVLEGVTDVT